MRKGKLAILAYRYFRGWPLGWDGPTRHDSGYATYQEWRRYFAMTDEEFADFLMFARIFRECL